jgi:hypothetical protein
VWIVEPRIQNLLSSEAEISDNSSKKFRSLARLGKLEKVFPLSKTKGEYL